MAGLRADDLDVEHFRARIPLDRAVDVIYLNNARHGSLARTVVAACRGIFSAARAKP